MLVFVPAPRDAYAVQRALKKPESGWSQMPAASQPSILLYTGTQSPEERESVLKAKETRIIIATAIAEAGLTFGHCSTVLSSGVCKTQVVDDATRRPQLVRTRASPQQLRQQAGRAGRTDVSRAQTCYQWVWQAGAALQTSLVAHQDLSQLASSPLAFSLRDKLVPKPSVAALKFLEEVHDYAQAQNRKVSQLRAKLALKLDGLAPEAKKLLPWHTDVSREIASLEEVLADLEDEMDIAEAVSRRAARLVLSSAGRGESQVIHYDEALRRVPAADQTVLPMLVADQEGWEEASVGLVHALVARREIGN